MSHGNPNSPEQAHIADLTNECDDLRAQLIKAQKRIALLEKDACINNWNTTTGLSGGVFSIDETQKTQQW